MNATLAHYELMPSGRLLNAYRTETYCEFVRLLRTPALVIPFLLVPLAAYVLFGVMIASEAIKDDPYVADYLFSGFSVMAVIGAALFGIGCTLAVEREAGLLQLKRAMPAPAGAWMVSKMIVGIAFSALSYLPLLIAAVIIGQLTVSPSELVAMSAVYLIGTIPFCALGMLIGTLASAGAAPAYANLLYLPMLWLSGMFFPLPEFLHAQTVAWPAFHLNQIALIAGNVEKFIYVPMQLSLGALAGLTVLCSTIAVWRLARRG